MTFLQQKTLFDIIQEKISLSAKNSRGWYDVRCAVCNDHSPRFGFFNDGVFTSGYCWNCGAKFKHEEGSGRVSKNARDILQAFGISNDDLTSIRSKMMTPGPEPTISLDRMTAVKLDTIEISLPERSLVLGSPSHEEFQEPLILYLLSRKIDPLKVKAYFSLDNRFLRRVIIPFYRNGRLIYWQARHIDDGVKPRYLNATVTRDAVIYGYDRLTEYSDAPLFVTEGVFDAMSLNGVCILGSTLNAAKIEILRRCRRRLIFVIDRDKTGSELGKVAIQNGWEISFVDREAGDANKSVQLFGLPYTIYRLMKNCTSKIDRDASSIILGLGVLEGKLGRFK